MGSRTRKNGDFGLHLGAKWRMKTSSFLHFSKHSPFIFNNILASLVQETISFLVSFLPFPARLPVFPGCAALSMPPAAANRLI